MKSSLFKQTRNLGSASPKVTKNLSMAGFGVITYGRFWVIAEAATIHVSGIVSTGAGMSRRIPCTERRSRRVGLEAGSTQKQYRRI
jgi:hypothetical protein